MPELPIVTWSAAYLHFVSLKRKLFVVVGTSRRRHLLLHTQQTHTQQPHTHTAKLSLWQSPSLFLTKTYRRRLFGLSFALFAPQMLSNGIICRLKCVAMPHPTFLSPLPSLSSILTLLYLCLRRCLTAAHLIWQSNLAWQQFASRLPSPLSQPSPPSPLLLLLPLRLPKQTAC